jgi:hypothetical protein
LDFAKTCLGNPIARSESRERKQLDMMGVIAFDLWFYVEWSAPVKTTVEVSDDLYRRAKAEAALRGRKLKDLVEEGLRLVLEAPRQSHRRRSLAVLMKGARGAVDSGVPDLASNPKHLTGFGHDTRRRR